MKKKILFDATLIANAGIKNSDRSGIFFAALKILLFEKNKFKKIKSIYKGFIDGILNKY